MHLKVWFVLTIAAVPVCGQALSGPYHFVRMQIREEAAGKISVRSGGGTITFDAQGAFKVKGHAGTNREAAAPFERAGSQAPGQAGRVMLTGVWDPKETIEARTGDGGAFVIGSSTAGPRTHDLFVAARAAETGGKVAASAGTYAGAYLSIANADPAALTTGYTEWSADGAGKIGELFAIAHCAGVDDVNRREEAKNLQYSMAPDGTGKVSLDHLDETALTGEHTLMLSRVGQVLLGYAAGAGRRSILVLVKKPPEQVSWMFAGPYWHAELGGESPYKFQPAALRFSSASGGLLAAGDGNAAISQQVRAGGSSLRLSTMNQYRLGTDGVSAFGPVIANGQRNLAVTESATIFAAAEVGLPGQLTLQHGIVVGMKTGAGFQVGWFPPAQKGPGSGMPMHSDYKPVAPAQPAKAGEALLVLLSGIGGGTAKGGVAVQVSFGGKPGEVKSTTRVVEAIDLWLVEVKVPADAAPGPAVPMVIQAGETLVDLFDVAIAK
jgi:uncharacterized protein (TIGR03437 family)